jgi:PemK-like, MazF-like toxin of type II toxin-antitoxin system
MTAYSFGDVVLVPFPFTDQTGNKKRPAVVVSSAAYHRARTDLIFMAVTSQIRASGGFGEISITGWKEAAHPSSADTGRRRGTAVHRPRIQAVVG